jgi:outer membrane protein insertion porin family
MASAGQEQLPMKKGDWYNAKLVEDTIEKLNETLGTFGYAFADVRPDYERNKDDLTMGLTFVIAEAPRVYVERIDVNGNTLTQDKVVRREFRIAEGDAFNSLQVKRSTNRIKSLGYFQEKFEIEQKPGSTPDRIVLEANVEEKPTGELQLSAGFSSLESFIFQARSSSATSAGAARPSACRAAIRAIFEERRGELHRALRVRQATSRLGVDIYRRDYNSFNYAMQTATRTYKQATTGFQLRAGLPLTEYDGCGALHAQLRRHHLDKNQFYLRPRHAGHSECDPLMAGATCARRSASGPVRSSACR